MHLSHFNLPCFASLKPVVERAILSIFIGRQLLSITVRLALSLNSVSRSMQPHPQPFALPIVQFELANIVHQKSSIASATQTFGVPSDIHEFFGASLENPGPC